MKEIIAENLQLRHTLRQKNEEIRQLKIKLNNISIAKSLSQPRPTIYTDMIKSSKLHEKVRKALDLLEPLPKTKEIINTPSVELSLGETFTGQLKNGLPHGFGICISPGTNYSLGLTEDKFGLCVYEGEWKEGEWKGP